MINALGNVLVLLALLTYLYYVCIVTRFEVKISIVKSIHAPSQRCNFLLSMSKGGKWKRKNHITDKDESTRREIDKRLRVRKGWPEYLAHGDLFCGGKHPLPRYSENQSDLIAFDIQSQCDAQSQTPCCHGDKGLCGHSPAYCTCPSCTDYRSFASAELSEWIPHENCVFKNYTQAEACNLLTQATNSIVFIGDSLVRHFFSALRIILTSNPNYGCLKKNIPKKYQYLCQGENQFTDGMCHAYIAMDGDDVCTRKSRKFHTSFIEAYNVKHLNVAISTIKKLLGEPFTYVLVGLGIHDNFDWKMIIGDYLEPIVSIVSSKGMGWPRLVWLTTHAAGPLKPMTYVVKQGNDAIRRYNQQIARFCYRNNITLFDTYNMTRQTYSYDGTHYGLGVNMVKAQVLLNFIEDQWIYHKIT